MITGIDHIHVYTKDMDQSIAFYTNVLGFRFLRRASFGTPENRRELAYVGLGDILLELLPLAAGITEVPSGGNRPLCLTVADMDRTLVELQEKGVEITRSWEGFSFSGRAASIKDPSGLDIELREWLTPDSPHYPDWQPTRADVVRTA